MRKYIGITLLSILFLAGCSPNKVYQQDFDMKDIKVGHARLITTRATPKWMLWDASTFSVWIVNKTGTLEFIPINATSPDILSEFTSASSLASKVTFPVAP